MPCYSPLKGYKDFQTGGLVFKRTSSAYEPMEVACGQCLGCRLDRSRTWAMRIVHEAQSHVDNCFITLTYRDRAQCTAEQLAGGWHLPDDGSLNKKHFQKFMKRLRKRFPDRRIRYYHCGEYGDELTRPHYHACLFGLDFEDKELFSENGGYRLYTSDVLADTWKFGFVTIGELTFESAAYTARYCVKKITGKAAHEHYLRWDEDGVAYWLQPEYTTMSRRPGIGRDWYEEFKSDLWPSDETPVPGAGVYPKVPRYYETILASEDPGQHEEIKELRQQFRKAHADEYTPQRLWQKYKVQLDRQALNNRRYEDESNTR